MPRKKIRDFIEEVSCDPKQIEIDTETIRAYCTRTNCRDCVLRKNGLHACRKMGAGPHPLDDPSYVALCIAALREVIDDSSSG